MYRDEEEHEHKKEALNRLMKVIHRDNGNKLKERFLTHPKMEGFKEDPEEMAEKHKEGPHKFEPESKSDSYMKAEPERHEKEMIKMLYEKYCRD